MKISIRAVFVILTLAASSPAVAAPVGLETAVAVADATLRNDKPSATPTLWADGEIDGSVLFYVFAAEPVGFVVVGGDDLLPPVIGYSLLDPLPARSTEREVFLGLLRTEIGGRFAAAVTLSSEELEQRRALWAQTVAGEVSPRRNGDYQQWPPAGTTATGGWLEANWHQNAPYNDQCPLDLVSGGRSVAGCPAVAMALIVDFNRNTNGTQLDNGDDYYHSYGGRQYWIDDDWASLDFPSFPVLSASLATLDEHYRQQLPATDADAASLVFACGVAAQQVYTASVSGTFGVNQAVDAYERFGVSGFELLDGTEPDLHDRLLANMQQAKPAHLAVLDPGGGGGHNLVIDGADTDGYYHLNFGWGGAANGWYLIPDEIPYGLTEYEGIIVDITIPLFRDGFESSGTGAWSEVTR